MFLKDLVTLVDDEEFELVDLDVLLLHQSQESSWRGNHDLWRVVFKSQNLSLLVDSSVDLSNRESGQELAKSFKLLGDLEGQLSGMTEYHCLESLPWNLNGLKNTQGKDGSLAHS